MNRSGGTTDECFDQEKSEFNTGLLFFYFFFVCLFFRYERIYLVLQKILLKVLCDRGQCAQIIPHCTSHLYLLLINLASVSTNGLKLTHSIDML